MASLRQLRWALTSTIGQTLGIIRDLRDQFKVLGAFYFGAVAPGWHSQRRINRRHILFISHYSSPYKSVYGTQRLGKLIKYLDRMGWRITLLTSTPARPEEIDPGAEAFPASIDVIRIPSGEAQALAGKKQLVPDDFVPWVMPAVNRVGQILADSDISLICTTAPPYSNLLAGAIASKRYGIPHVTDFRDPWSRIDTGWILGNPMSRALTRHLERRVLRQADAIVMADELKYAGDYFYGGSAEVLRKVSSVLNGYDEEDVVVEGTPDGRRSEKFVISYVGKFYGQESFDHLILPIKMWQRDFPEDFADVVLEYAGAASARFDKSNFRPAYLIDHGYVTHKEAVAIRLRSMLQLFTQPKKFKPHVLSGKIYEMIASNVPILAVTNPSGAVGELIVRTGTGFVVDRDDPAGTAALLKSLYDQWRGGALQISPNTEAIRSLSRENQARRFAAVLEGVLAQTTGPG